MTWLRIPLFVWSIEAYAVLLVLALPAISAAAASSSSTARPGRRSSSRRTAGARSFYQLDERPTLRSTSLVTRDGDALGDHPVFSRKPIFGYRAVAFSTIGIAFASMLVWAHHMFTVGLPIWRERVLPRLVARGRHPDRGQDLQLARDALAQRLDLWTPLLYCLGFI